jgi:hypothetical protein
VAFFISGAQMPEDQMPEFPAELLERFKLNERDVELISTYLMASMRRQMRNEFYRDVGKGVVRVGWKVVLAIGLYLAWKGSGGPSGWLEPVRKFLVG